MPEPKRIDFWRGAIQGLLGIDSHIVRDVDRPFRACLTARSAGPLLTMNFAAARHPVRRDRADINRRRWDSYFIYCERSVGAQFEHAGRNFTTQVGDVVVADADAAFNQLPAADYAHEMWMVPKAMLDPYLPAGGRPLSVTLSARTGVDALGAAFLDALTRNWDNLPESSMGAVTDTLCRLVGIACGAAVEGQPKAVQQARLMQARQHIDLNLASPALCPASSAAALKISLRSLHSLFEQNGTSFARYVLQRRLQECRAALLANPTRPVIDVAFAWGFGSLSSFYRAFHTAFGMSPSDARAASPQKLH